MNKLIKSNVFSRSTVLTACILIVFGILPAVAHADFIWPALILEKHLLTWWAILAGLVVEFFFVLGITAMNPLKSGLATLAMNAVSTILGIVLIPVLSSVAVFLVPGKFHFSRQIVNASYWGITIALAALGNSWIETRVLQMFSKAISPRKMFWWLWVANVLSVGLAYASLRQAGQEINI